MKGVLLKVEGVKKSFGGLKAIRGVDLEVKRGERILIIGPNGSGKSTLINVISGVYRPDGGKVFFKEREITNLPPHEIARLGIIRTFQVPAVFGKLTVLENLLVAAKRRFGETYTSCLFKRRSWMEEEEELVKKAFELLKLLKIDHLWDKPASSLSGGQLKLLEMGKVAMAEAELVLMDEPVAGIHPYLAHNLLNKLVSLERERTYVIVEHRLDIILDYVDYVYAMHQGEIIAEGKPFDVLKDARLAEVYLGA